MLGLLLIFRANSLDNKELLENGVYALLLGFSSIILIVLQ
jgi:hypothetical protein